MNRRGFRSAYYTLSHKGQRIACFFHYDDLAEYARRSILAGCSSNGWVVRMPDGSNRRLRFESRVFFDNW